MEYVALVAIAAVVIGGVYWYRNGDSGSSSSGSGDGKPGDNDNTHQH